jgi:phosphoribosylformylglycinamidine synthase
MARPEEFLALPGSPAYSPFRLAVLKDSLNSSLNASRSSSLSSSRVLEVRSIYVHYVCPKTESAASRLSDSCSFERKSLEQLLVYGDQTSLLNHDAETEVLVGAILSGFCEKRVIDGAAKNRLLLYVAPRKGTISPWSSKATSITHVCGLDAVVERVERGVLFSLVFDDGYEHQDGVQYPFADALYDRMTQVYSS